MRFSNSLLFGIFFLVSFVHCQNSFSNSYAYSTASSLVPRDYGFMAVTKDILLFFTNQSQIEITRVDKLNFTTEKWIFGCDKIMGIPLGDTMEDTFYISVSYNPGYFYNQTIMTIYVHYSIVGKFRIDDNGNLVLLYKVIYPLESIAVMTLGNDGTVLLGGNDNSAAFISKMNATDGTLLWTKYYGSSQSLVREITVDILASQIWAAGTSDDGMNGKPPVMAGTGSDIWVMNLDMDGTNRSTTVFGTSDSLEAPSALIYLNESLFVVGYVSGYQLIQDGTSIGQIPYVGDCDIFISKLDPINLQIESYQTLGTAGYDFPQNAVVDMDGNIKVYSLIGDNFQLNGVKVEGNGSTAVAKFHQDLQLAYLFQLPEPSNAYGVYAEPNSATFYLFGPTLNATNEILFQATDKCMGNTDCNFTLPLASPSMTPSTSPVITGGSTGSDSSSDAKPKDNTAVIAGAVAGGGAVIIGSAIAAFFLVKRRNQAAEPENRELELRPEPAETMYQEIQSRPATSVIKGTTDQVTVVDDIQIESRLGGGFFGEVYKGLWHGSTAVALKRLKDGSMFNEFLAEAQVLQNLSMPFIVRFFGIWTDKDGGKYIVTEFMAKGSLKDFLDENEKTLRVEDLILLIKDIAAGMKFMAAKGFIHRDLAARNILVKEEEGRYVAKVADFGLARLTQSNYYTKGGAIPIRWSAPEVLSKEKYSTKSDVWAFGILLWEIFEFGKVPYMGKSNEEVCNVVLTGSTLTQPSFCPNEIWELIMKCWSFDASARPTFEDIYNSIAGIATSYGLYSYIESGSKSDNAPQSTYTGLQSFDYQATSPKNV